MARTERRPGARELRLRDWPYGAVGRRLVLETLLLERQPREGWLKSELEERARVRTGGIDVVLAGAVRWRLVERRDDGRWERADPLPDIAGPLEELLELTRNVRDAKIPPLPKRPYRRAP